ncbi:unnamed protein product [Tuber aestivum]|uniref:Uncharacterized protein n=1 Tax=Tuber aestivum TaxID=59557 RepID=A0A292Q6H4_9PEZI|nr:unnamed protein product [Tuber aestivum]
MASPYQPMENPDTVIEHQTILQDAQNPALDLTPDRPAGDLMWNVHPEWHKHYQDRAERLKAKNSREMQNVEAYWVKRYDALDKEIAEKSTQIGQLENSLKKANMACVKLYDNFNLRGALGAERIVEHAKELNKFHGNCPSGTQAALNVLATTHAFKKILAGEIKARGLDEKDVQSCIPLVYHECSKRAHGNTGMITIYSEDHTSNECAALVAFLKLQSGWGGGLKWREVDER